MDKKQKDNKIGESFEKQPLEEQLPESIWEGIANALDAQPTKESTEKIKTSFENGFDEEPLPDLWGTITNQLEGQVGTNNKIKSSFENIQQGELPQNIWENVENQLEIEAVWERVYKALNKRTKKRYWQEKGIQLGIAALAVLSLRGCGIGETFMSLPVAQQVQERTVVEQVKTTTPLAESSIGNNLLTQEAVKSIPECKNQENTEKQVYRLNQLTTPVQHKKINSSVEQPTQVTPMSLEITLGDKEKANHKDNLPNELLIETPKTKTTVGKKYEDLEISNAPVTSLVTKGHNKKALSNTSFEQTQLDHSLWTPIAAVQLSKLPNNTLKEYMNNPLFLSSEALTTSIAQTSISERKLLAIQPTAITDSNIYALKAVVIESMSEKQRPSLRFELGLNAQVGTSLLLGGAMQEAMEETSMSTTEIEPNASLGVALDCYLSANDAISLGVYPFSNTRQHFEGYTSEGRYYNKEIKLSYVDISLGYQRTLLHYNDFGTIPSSIYARLDYGFGYLSQGEEVVNEVSVNLGNTYNKINHHLGLSIGNTHRVQRVVINYGLSANMGISSVLNQNSAGGIQQDYTHLLNMGGYVGLRYAL